MNNLFVSNLKRAFCSKRFVLATIGTTIISFASSHTYLSDGQSSAYVLDLLLNLSMFKKLIVFFAALPFVTVFCQDFGSGFIKSIVIRSNEKSYVLSSIIAVALSGFSAVFVGIMSYFAIVSFYVPCIPYETAGTYSSIAFNNPVLFVFVLVSIFSLYASM